MVVVQLAKLESRTAPLGRLLSGGSARLTANCTTTFVEVVENMRTWEDSDGRADVIEKILQHRGLWQSRSARAPPGVQELVLELDAAFADSVLESADRADESQDLTYVDIDTFLENFSRPPMHIGLGTMRPS